MYSELYRYFIQHKKLYVPGIGQFILERKPAEADFVNKAIHPPVYSVSLQQEAARPSSKFYAWLAAVFNIGEKEAIIRFNDFVFDLKNQINNGNRIEWNGIGVISKGLGDTIRFTADEISSPLKAVPAVKIIRDKAEHSVLVGERERTSAEMTEYFSAPGAKKNNWWILPLAIILLAFMFIGWQFSKNGLTPSSAGVSKKIQSAVSGNTYRELK